MIRRPDPIYVVFRNDQKWRHFTSRQNAINRLADKLPDPKGGDQNA